MARKRVTVEPLSVRLRGFTVDDLFSKEFIEALRKELPNVLVEHIGIAFQGSEDYVEVSHSQEDKKTILEYVDVEGNDPKLIQAVARAIEKGVG
jgi:septum formation topological specificity factor MinE